MTRPGRRPSGPPYLHSVYSESYIEDLTVDSTLKHFVNSKKDFKGLMSKKIQNHANFIVCQNAGFIMERQNCLMVLVSIILGGFVIIFSSYVIIFGD